MFPDHMVYQSKAKDFHRVDFYLNHIKARMQNLNLFQKSILFDRQDDQYSKFPPAFNILDHRYLGQQRYMANMKVKNPLKQISNQSTLFNQQPTKVGDSLEIK